MNIENHKYHHGNLSDEILTAAYNFVSENGYAAMSLRGIAENCNVSATAIYRHYKTKEHLLADVVVKGLLNSIYLLREILKLTFLINVITI
jgi:AcrR family transcriptional regulator